ncbi:iron-sulfur cluster assembly protein, partial [Haematococcus lacustris]
ELTEENVEKVLDEVRPYLMADGGNVEFVEIDGLVVRLKLNGACGSCPSSLTTMTMGIKRRLIEKIPDALVVSVWIKLMLSRAGGNVEKVLDEVRPYLMADGGNVEFVEIDGLVVRLKLNGACGSCPSSLTTMTMGIKRRLIEKIP